MALAAPRGINLVPTAQQDEVIDDDFDFKGTSRKEYENMIWRGVCSEIIDEFLYLGSDVVAKDEEAFKKA